MNAPVILSYGLGVDSTAILRGVLRDQVEPGLEGVHPDPRTDKESSMSSRIYVVGLPVVVTVDDAGTVAYQVDTSEAGAALRDDDIDTNDQGISDEVLFADAQRVDDDHARRSTAAGFRGVA